MLVDETQAAPAATRPRERLNRLYWRRFDLCIPFLALLPLLVFAPQATGRAVFSGHDIQYYFYPYHVAAARLIADGHLPLWNPYAFGGIPLLGDGQTALLSPFSWLFLVPGLAPATALTWAILLHFSVAALGSYGLGRALGLGRAAALVAAIAYAFGGFMTARIIHLSILGGAALLPLVLLGLEWAMRSGPRWPRRVAVAALVIALQLVSGHPQVPVYTMLAAGLFVGLRAIERAVAEGDWRPLLVAPLRAGGAYLLGAGLAALQLLPWVELAERSPRAASASFKFVFERSKVGDDWLLLLFPYLHGAMRRGIYGLAAGFPTPIRLWEQSAYVGILPLALGVVGLVGPCARWPQEPQPRAEARRRWFALAFLALLLALGVILAAGWNTPLADYTYQVPVLGQLRDVERSVVLASLALALLAGFGLQRLIDAGPMVARNGWRIGLALLAALTFALPLGVVWLARGSFLPDALTERGFLIENWQLLRADRANALVPLLLAAASATLLLSWSALNPTAFVGRARALAAVALVVADLGLFASAFHDRADPRLYAGEPPAATFLRADPGPFRVAVFLPDNRLDEGAARARLAVSWAMVFGIEDINGFNSLQPRRYTDYLFGPDRADVSYGILNDPTLLLDDSPVLSALGVNYLVVPRNVAINDFLGLAFRPVYADRAVTIYQNDRAYPRAYYAASAFPAPDDLTTLATVTAPGFDGRALALVEADPAAIAALPDLPLTDRDRVALVDRAPDRLTVRATATAPRLLVLSEMDYPGWQATIDGAPTPIHRANYLYRSLIVPPGDHTVELTYRPASVGRGLAVSAVSLVIVAVLLLVGTRLPRSIRR